MTISYSFAACCLFGVVFLQSKAGDCVESQLTNLSLIKEPRTDSPSKCQILLGQVSFLSLPLVIGVVMCFFVGNVFESFWLRAIWRELRKLDDYVLRGEREHFKYANPNTAHAQSVDYLSVGRSIFCHAILTTRFPWVHVCVQHVTRSHWGSWAHVRLPRTINFQNISHKKHIAIPMTEGRDKRLTIPQGFDGFMVNQCPVLWCGRDLWVKTAHSHLPCFALCRKTTPNKQRAAKLYKMAMNWAKVTQEKQQQAQVYVSTIYFYIHAYISTF